MGQVKKTLWLTERQTDSGSKGYRIEKIQNTVSFGIGQILPASRVKDLIDSGYTINVARDPLT